MGSEPYKQLVVSDSWEISRDGMGTQQGRKNGGKCTHRSGDNFVTIGAWSMPGHCPGKILVNCAYFFVREFSCDVAAPLCVSPARVTWQF